MPLDLLVLTDLIRLDPVKLPPTKPTHPSTTLSKPSLHPRRLHRRAITLKPSLTRLHPRLMLPSPGFLLPALRLLHRAANRPITPIQHPLIILPSPKTPFRIPQRHPRSKAPLPVRPRRPQLRSPTFPRPCRSTRPSHLPNQRRTSPLIPHNLNRSRNRLSRLSSSLPFATSNLPPRRPTGERQ
jgi:hypothetical protein